MKDKKTILFNLTEKSIYTKILDKFCTRKRYRSDGRVTDK